MWKKSISLILIVTSFSISCKKEEQTPKPTLEERMPVPTEIGARKLMAIINDEYIFESNNLGFQSVSMNSWYLEDYNGELNLKAFYHYYGDNFTVFKETIFIRLHGVYSVGEYNINSGSAYFIKEGIFYPKDSVNAGSLSITTYDTLNDIIAGTFNLNLLNNEQNETITITNGWFDILN